MSSVESTQSFRAAHLARRPGVTAPGGPVRRSLERFRIRLTAEVSDAAIRGFARAARLHPNAQPARHRVQVLRDLAYGDRRASQVLDVYRPLGRPLGGPPPPWPVVLYVHGGGFATLSKDTHWLMGLTFARAGYLVLNISYRLAPRHPFPAALEDAAAAYRWMVETARSLGGDLDRVIVAGESAGANLITALAVSASYRRPEPYAAAVFDTGVVPRIAVPFCGILEVANWQRFERKKKLPPVVRGIIRDVALGYIGEARAPSLELASPLALLERGEAPARPLPAFFIPVGTRDPLLDDTRRLARAASALGAVAEARYYPDEIHAFQALIWRPQARRCWRDTLQFCRTHLGGAPGTSPTAP